MTPTKRTRRTTTTMTELEQVIVYQPMPIPARQIGFLQQAAAQSAPPVMLFASPTLDPHHAQVDSIEELPRKRTRRATTTTTPTKKTRTTTTMTRARGRSPAALETGGNHQANSSKRQPSAATMEEIAVPALPCDQNQVGTGPIAITPIQYRPLESTPLLSTLTLLSYNSPPVDTTLPDESKLSIREEGRVVAHRSTIEIQTCAESTHRVLLSSEKVVPQLWISQNRSLLLLSPSSTPPSAGE
jgi:hypothetical protein